MALVGDPTHTNSYAKIMVDGKPIWVCNNLVDYDFKSLYPSIMGEFNIAPNTQIGKIEIDKRVYDDENAYHIEAEKYSRGGEFIENLVTDNMIEYCHRWFHLGNIVEVINDIDEFYNDFGFGKYSNLISAGFNGDGHIIPIKPTASKGISSPVRFNQSPVYNPVTFYTKRDPSYNYNDLYARKENK